MPGTSIRDAQAPVLIDDETYTADTSSTGVTTGGRLAAFAGKCTAVLQLGAISGTNPTMRLDILVTNTAVIDSQVLGSFYVTDADANSTKYLDMYVDGLIGYAAVDVGGTSPSFEVVKLSLEQPHVDRRHVKTSGIKVVDSNRSSQ